MRVLIGLGEIAGYCTKLNDGLQSLGIDSTFINLRQHPFQYAEGVQWPLVRLIQQCNQRYRTAGITKPLWGILQLALSAVLLGWCIFRFDVFIFVFGTSFLLLHDLPLFKLFGKKVIFLFLGSDARPPYLNGAFIGESDPATISACIRKTRQVKRRVKQIERFADVVISLPTYGQFHQKPFVLYSIIGFPGMDTVKTPEAAPDGAGHGNVRILHSPSNPILKGTPQIRKAIEHLRARGYGIDWIELTGQPNTVVLRELEQCDFIVDQLYADWLMPGFATEAAAAGKPSIVAGYDLEAIQKQLPAAFTPPVHACHPDDIEAGIEKLIVDRDYRLELGQRAQAFVESCWSSPQMAERFLKIIQGDIPEAWLYHPGNAQDVYLHGGGVSEAQLIPFLKAYFEQGGRAALQLADKPNLEQAFVDFAFTAKSSPPSGPPPTS